jgi:hypothetical protein
MFLILIWLTVPRHMQIRAAGMASGRFETDDGSTCGFSGLHLFGRVSVPKDLPLRLLLALDHPVHDTFIESATQSFLQKHQGKSRSFTQAISLF